MATLVERTSRFVMLVALPHGHKAPLVRDARLAESAAPCGPAALTSHSQRPLPQVRALLVVRVSGGRLESAAEGSGSAIAGVVDRRRFLAVLPAERAITAASTRRTRRGPDSGHAARGPL
jgi:hypothetical protein